ncbi:MAG: transposase family protein [Elusimicrobia bacterium]|nr:transposase family protein [Elusimicrobiota bacterium]
MRKIIRPYRDLWKAAGAPRNSRKADTLQRPRTPNLVWSTDWTECRVNGRTFFVLVALDEAARFFTGWKILDRVPKSSDLRSFLEETLERYEERPVLLKSDRAQVFMSADWAALLEANGVAPHRVRPHSPWEQGTIERAIPEVKAWIRAGGPRNPSELIACIDEGMSMLNFLKPKAVLGGRTPARVFLGTSETSDPASRRALAAAAPMEISHA